MNQSNTVETLRVFKATVAFKNGCIEDLIHSYTLEGAQACAERVYPSAHTITVEEDPAFTARYEQARAFIAKNFRGMF
jgi:hypothetical protein